MWTGDRWDYVFWLQERLCPSDRAGQSLVLRLVYAEALPLTYEEETDLALLRTHLAQAIRKNTHENCSE